MAATEARKRWCAMTSALRAAIYCRVSTQKQLGEGKTSIDDQLSRCREACVQRGWTVVEVFDEGDASAGTAQRGEFQRMIAAAKAGAFDFIVCREVSRLSRVAQARRAIEELMVEWGIGVLNAKNGMLYSEGEGLGAGLIWHLEAKLAEAEWVERAHRTNQGMFGKAKAGVVPGSKAPYGYRWSADAPKQLLVEPDEADTVRAIFRQIAAGKTCAQVARDLDLSLVPTPSNSERGWWPATVFDIATRKAYVGRFEFGRQRWVRLNSERDRQAWARDYAVRHGRAPKVIPAKIRVPGDQVFECACPSIVSDSLFRATGRRLSKSRKGAREARSKPELLGLLRCEECGREMRATWAKGRNGSEYHFYRCAQATKDPTRFPCRTADRQRGLTAYVNAGALESLVWTLVDQMLSDPVTLETAVGLRLADQAEWEPSAQNRLGRHQLRLSKTVRAWEQCRRLYFAGDLDSESFARDREHYERELAMLREEIERMQRSSEERARQRDQLELIGLVAASWPAIREGLTESDRRLLVSTLVSDITVSREDEVTVSGKLTPLGGSTVEVSGGRYWIRTSDLCDVNAAL